MGYASSYAIGVSGGIQVGIGLGPATGDQSHALLWSGTAASVVDLNPAGFRSSWASDVSGGIQVGYGSGPATFEQQHALLWNGTAASAVDLHSYMSSDFTGSIASGIAADGTIVGTAFGHVDCGDCAVLWTPVPDPIPGDYNQNGTVDAADYTVWRKNDGTQAGYNAWRANFGALLPGSGVSVLTAIPEPSALALVAVCSAVVGRRTQRRFRAASRCKAVSIYSSVM
jgi:hypothetical protein